MVFNDDGSIYVPCFNREITELSVSYHQLSPVLGTVT